MGKVWVITIAAIVFIVLSFLFYKSMRGYVREEYGKKWLTLWGNKLYFWQSLVFVSMAGTALIMYILKWSDVLDF
ncbi:hypothetical protein J1N09_02905 [Aureitalea sp. L0-47]|nr:hypothetical protein [Aureitalea sp. L0-47]